MHTEAASISYTVAPSQKPKLIGWTDPALDIADLRYHVGRDVAVVIGATRDAGQVQPTASARHVFELAPFDDDEYSRTHLPFLHHFYTIWRLGFFIPSCEASSTTIGSP
jgi:hypothetical protein